MTISQLQVRMWGLRSQCTGSGWMDRTWARSAGLVPVSVHMTAVRSVLEGWKRMGIVETRGQLWRPCSGRALPMSGDSSRELRERLVRVAARGLTPTREDGCISDHNRAPRNE